MGELQRTALLRKVDSFAARARRLTAHLCVLCHIQSKLPWTLRATGRQVRMREWACANLPRLVVEAQRRRGLSVGDLPDLDSFRTYLSAFDFSLLPTWDPRDYETLQHVIDVEIPSLMHRRAGVSTVRTRCRAGDSPS